MAKRITSIDVAKRAGVSQPTVSRVFSTDSPNVKADKKERVLKAADELGYRPNVIARMMSTSKTNIIGIVMANITSPFYPYVLDKFLQRLNALDRQVLLFAASANQKVDDILPLILQYQVDALIVTSATLSSEMADECARNDMPVILFNRYVTGANVSAVCADNVEGGRRIADLLLDTGHQQLAYIAGNPDTSTNIDRHKGFTERLREHGYTKLQHVQGKYTYDAGYYAAYQLLQGTAPPDAIFCANDIMAIGAMDAARELGISVPSEVSIVGFDDIPMASWQAYKLTTISQEVDEMIDATIELLLDKLEDPQSTPVLKLVPGQLKIRESVRGISPN